jgi:YidC/Oxa1 family membrane protein insertase
MSSPTPPEKKPREIPNELRMVLAFVLMGLILVATPYVYKRLGIIPAQQAAPLKSAVQTPKAATQGAPPESAQSESPAAASAALASSAPVAGVKAGVSESEWTLDTGVYRVTFSSRGAVVKSWTLRNYKDAFGKPLELVNARGAEKAGYPFSYDFRGQQPSTNLDKALWIPHPGADGLTLEYEFSDGRTVAKKTFAFQRDGYMVQFSDEVKLNGVGLPHLLQWRAGFGDGAVTGAAGHQENIRFDSEKNKLVTEAAKSAKNGPIRADGAFAFAGIEDQYFTAVFLPPPNTNLQTTTFNDMVASSADASEQAFPGFATGGEARNQLGLYVGPKELEELRRVNPRLQDVIDWGFFGFIAKPLFLILQWMNTNYVHSYGWAIILVTVLINIAMFPLKLANLKSMRKMQSLQPELNRINEKYKGISMSDPRAANKQQETMDLYKKHGVNPMGGCIPMVIQLPFLWAFYKVLSVAIEMRNAHWLWVTDLSQPEHYAIRVLPIVMIVSSFLMQKMTPMTGGDPAQQKVMQFMPLMYGFFFWPASSGLVLYWLTSNLVGIAQQWFFNKTAGPLAASAASKKAIAASLKDGRKRA